MRVFMLIVALLPMLAMAAEQPKSEEPDFHTFMMLVTVKLIGPDGTSGTGFIVSQDAALAAKPGNLVLVTAAHVFESVKGDEMTVVFRKRDENGKWARSERKLTFKEGEKKLWSKHADVDAAAIVLPEGLCSCVVAAIQTEYLLDDKKLEEFDVHPGKDLICLGFPYGIESSPAGFPILRSGKIASYPIFPSKETKSFLFDFNVFPGNSGGPVYFEDANPRGKGNSLIIGVRRGIIGLVTSELSLSTLVQAPREQRQIQTPLQLGAVVHASFIKELVESLKPQPQKEK